MLPLSTLVRHALAGGRALGDHAYTWRCAKAKKRYTAACARSSYVGAVSVRSNLVGMRCSLHVHMRAGYERYADVRLTVWVARRRA